MVKALAFGLGPLKVQAGLKPLRSERKGQRLRPKTSSPITSGLTPPIRNVSIRLDSDVVS